MEFIDKFEYLVKSFREIRSIDLTNKLNEFGTDGWELVSILPIQTGNQYIFKRKIEFLKK